MVITAPIGGRVAGMAVVPLQPEVGSSMGPPPVAEGSLQRPEVEVVHLGRLDDLERGLHPDRVTINCGGSGGFAAVNLLPAANRQRKAITPQLVNLALGALTLLLLVGAVSLPLLNKRQQIEALEPLLETASAKAEEARRLRKEVDQLTANSRFLTDKKRASRPVLELLDELTRILPDDTWITRLDIKGSELEIQGQSASAAALIPLIPPPTTITSPKLLSATFLLNCSIFSFSICICLYPILDDFFPVRTTAIIKKQLLLIFRHHQKIASWMISVRSLISNLLPLSAGLPSPSASMSLLSSKWEMQ